MRPGAEPDATAASGGWVTRGVRRGAALWHRGGLLRFAVSGALFALLIWKMDAAQLVLRWREIRVGPFLLAVLVLEASNLLACVQWRTLLRAQGLRPRWGLVVSSLHVGLFVSNFLPGYYGGDAVRVYDIYRDSGEGASALAATFIDRVLGLVSLCLLALAVAPAFLGRNERDALLILGVISLALVGLLAVLFSRRAARPFRFLMRPFDALGLARRLRAGYDAVNLYRHRGRALGVALLLSLIVQALRVVVHWETALALGVHTELRNFFLVVPLVAVFIAVPVSLNGIGVREGSGIVLFGRVGVGHAEAFGLLFLAYVAGVVVSLPGGVLLALRGRGGRPGKGEAAGGGGGGRGEPSLADGTGAE